MHFVKDDIGFIVCNQEDLEQINKVSIAELLLFFLGEVDLVLVCVK